MKRYQLVGMGLAASLLGCGDNITGEGFCGAGTVYNEDSDRCEPESAPPMCTNGTILDMSTNSCVIDPNACQDGTVLVDGACKDPGHVDTDITEAMEPNGLGLFGEASSVPAGTIEIKPVGMSFVFTGEIIPFQDADGDGQMDPDIDAYVVTVQAPSLIDVTADGLHGLAAGFLGLAVVPQGDPLEPWFRFGVNLTGDTSKRQIYLPAPGSYVIAVADTRSLFLAGGAAGAETGKDSFRYYVTVSAQTIAPTALTVTSGVATDMGPIDPGQVKLFTVPMGLGINQVTLGGTLADRDQSLASVVIANTSGGTTSVRAVADEQFVDDNGTPDPLDDTFAASAAALGFKTGDTTTVVVDHQFNYALAPLTYDLLIQTGNAGALSTNGMDVTQPANAVDFTVFFYDVAASNEITGMDLTFDTDVAAVVVNENFEIFSFFTFDPFFGFGFGDTLSFYKGLLRHAAPGRYYFLTFDPTNTATMITATSSYAALTPVAITNGTPTASQDVNAFEANPFSYEAGSVAWQQFDSVGTATGNQTLRYYSPVTAFGQLDTGDIGNSDNTCGTFCADAAPIFTTTHAEAGQARGRILLDDATTMYVITINTATVTGASFVLDFEERPHSDLATLTVGTDIVRMDEPLDTVGNATRRYLYRTNIGNRGTITVSPDGIADDTQIQVVSNTEAVSRTIDNGLPGQDDSGTVIQGGSGWTAFTVSSVIALPVATTFDLTIAATPPPYGITNGNTAYDDACAGGGSVVAMTNVNGDPDDDESRSAIIDSPTGFDFFAAPAPQFRVFANGFVSFDTSAACSGTFSCFFSNPDMPNTAAPNAVIGAYWDDLVVTVCQKTMGSKLIIQWDGDTFSGGQVVQFQAILDGADDTIEFVYSGAHVPTGLSGTIGVENATGTDTVKVGFNTAGVVTPGASKKLTPQ